MFLSADLPGEPPPAGWSLHRQLPPEDLDDLLDCGADVFRSVLDLASLPFYVDVDYLNARLPGHAYARPGDVFAKLEPTYQAVVELLAEYGIETVPLMTGRGYQFTGRIPFDSPVFGRIAALAPETPDWYDTYAARLPPWLRLRITTRYARAYLAMGQLLEYFAHRVIRRAASRSRLPLVLNGTNVGDGAEGREAVSLDLSFAGDPADVRHMRVAFGAYQAHRFRPDIYGPEVSALDPIVVVPRGERTLVEMLEACRHPAVSGRRLAHIHANDHHGRFDDHLPPGDGLLDWAALGRDLQQVKFDGWIMLELQCPDHRSLEDHFVRARRQLVSRLP